MRRRPASPKVRGATTPLATRENLGFLLAKASQRWNELLYDAFRRAGYGDVRPAHGSILVPLFEEDGLRMGELAKRSRLSKQAMTALIRVMERRRLIIRRRDPVDARASRIYLTPRTLRFQAVAERILHEMDERVEAELTSGRKTQVTAALKTLMDLTR
ncbi:MAG TPA: MarR family transcriptional regulator [Candidatus Acidoferrales bacterium]|nr:MarR family transcriptional regulator [Candidatus Acidoferrales bacterium]